MSVSLEETIAKLDEVHKRGLLGIYGIKISRILKLLRELQERRKADNEIPFGDSYSFTELDSIINAYEVHGGYHKKVVELLKELRERRERSEIAKPTGESAQIVPNEDLISRKSAIDAVRDSYDEILDFTSTGRTISDSVEDIISDLPSAQPDIIRCKDCKHKGTKNCVANAWTTIFGFGVKDDFYCGLAERVSNE